MFEKNVQEQRFQWILIRQLLYSPPIGLYGILYQTLTPYTLKERVSEFEQIIQLALIHKLKFFHKHFLKARDPNVYVMQKQRLKFL